MEKMNVLYNRSEKRLRAFWRLLIQFIVAFIGQGVLSLLALGVFRITSQRERGSNIQDGTRGRTGNLTSLKPREERGLPPVSPTLLTPNNIALEKK